MSYSQDTDLLKQLSVSELCKLSGNDLADGINSERTAEARRQADSLIDAYLAGHFEVPFVVVPEIINQISIELTVANLYEFAYKNTSVPNTITWRKIEAMKLLKDIKIGIVAINATSETKNSATIICNKSSNDILFSKDLLGKY